MYPDAGPIHPPWVEHPYRLISWWDMENFSAEQFCEITHKLCILEHAVEDQPAEQKLSPKERRFLIKHLPKMSTACASIGLKVAGDHISHLSNRCVSGVTFREIRTILSGLSRTIMYEMQSALFLHVPAKDVKYYVQPEPLFFAGFRDAFPSAISEAEEAGKCLALNRHTASVFHLMRIMEVGLKAFAKKLGIPYAPSWESYFRQLRDLLEIEWKDKTPELKQDQEFYREAAAHLGSVKLAWRNPTMHVVKTYSFEETEEVFGSVRAFMRHLATKLKE